MSDKQLSSLSRAISGAALFIGGALLYSVSSWGTFFMVGGVVLMLTEEILRFIKWFMEPVKTEDKENETN